jgi:hypothetical protein
VRTRSAGDHGFCSIAVAPVAACIETPVPATGVLPTAVGAGVGHRRCVAANVVHVMGIARMPAVVLVPRVRRAAGGNDRREQNELPSNRAPANSRLLWFRRAHGVQYQLRSIVYGCRGSHFMPIRRDRVRTPGSSSSQMGELMTYSTRRYCVTHLSFDGADATPLSLHVIV